MLDLNSTLFYKASFQIASQEEQDLLWNVVLKIKRWIVPKWERHHEPIPKESSLWSMFKHGCNFSSAHHIVHFKSVYHYGAMEDFWSCKIIETQTVQGQAPREWTTEIGVHIDILHRTTVSIVIYYSDRPGFIGPCQTMPMATIPKIIRMFVEDPSLTCTVSGYPFDLKPKKLVPGMFPDFWHVVCDPLRDVPVVYLSPRKVFEEPDTTKTLLDPVNLTQILGPNALVYYSTNLDFSREMTQLCTPDSLGCYSGALRVYAPHPDINNPTESYRHRLIPARKILEHAEEVYGILRRALAQDIHFYDKMLRIEDCIAMNEKQNAEEKRFIYRQKLEEALLQEKTQLEEDLLQSAVKKETQLDQELDHIVNERLSWESQKNHYENQIQGLKEDLYQSQAREDSFRTEAQLSSKRKKALDRIRTINRYPESPEEICACFESLFPDRIAFTANGKASLASCKTSPSVLWNALYQTATTLYDLYEDDTVPQVDKAFNQVSNLTLARGEGRMTRKDSKLMQQYTDTYQGKEIHIETHLKTSENKESSSKFLRIYFCYDHDLHKLIIGSCGKHLDNYTTQKIK